MKPHRTDALSLSFGVLFLVAAGLWLFAHTTSVPLPVLGWIAVGAVGAVGIGGIAVAAATRHRDNP